MAHGSGGVSGCHRALPVSWSTLCAADVPAGHCAMEQTAGGCWTLGEGRIAQQAQLQVADQLELAMGVLAVVAVRAGVLPQ